VVQEREEKKSCREKVLQLIKLLFPFLPLCVSNFFLKKEIYDENYFFQGEKTSA
jgi:hypothetical protein